MKNTLAVFAALAVVGVAACSNGGSSTTPTPSPTVAATNAPSPSVSPTSVVSPTASPLASSTPSAIPTPTIAPVNVLRAAPIAANPVGLSFLRKTQAGGVSSSLPLLVESSGSAAVWAGNFVVWVTNAVSGLDVQETSGTITATNGVPVNNPSFSAISCPAASSVWCAAHPLGWEFGTASVANKPVGKQTLTVAFGDGLTGSIPDYIYDGWNLPCNTGIAYVGGVPVPQATKNTSDVYADCVNGNLVFPKGGILAFQPTQDSYGRYEPILPTVTAAIFISSAAVNFPMASIAQGQVYGINTQDGGMAKIYASSQSSPTAINALNAMSLHAKPDGSYAF